MNLDIVVILSVFLLLFGSSLFGIKHNITGNRKNIDRVREDKENEIKKMAPGDVVDSNPNASGIRRIIEQGKHKLADAIRRLLG